MNDHLLQEDVRRVRKLAGLDLERNPWWFTPAVIVTVVVIYIFFG